MAALLNHHRRAAIVCMDVVGFSAMMAKDEDRTLDILRKCHERVISPAIGKYGGRLFGRAGDNWLVEFEEVNTALGFSLSIQQEVKAVARLDEDMSPLQLRTGLNFGEVIDDGGNLFGNGVNVAVRLQGIASPGGIALSGAVRQKLNGDVDCKLRKIGPRKVKNIPEPIMVYRVDMDGEGRGEEHEHEHEHEHELGQGKGEGERGSGKERAHRLADERGSPRIPGLENRPAVAVLPFRNIGHDPEEEFFSDGLTEDIINGLSRLRVFPVISRGGTFRFKDSSEDVREIGKRLGARYVVEGSVRRIGRRLRATVQLTDTGSGLSIWAERYDCDLDDIFKVQEEIARSVVATIDPELSRAEEIRSRNRPVESLDNWELIRRGMWHLNRLSREDAALAKDCFEQALERDPESVEALIQMSWWYFWNVWARRLSKEGLVEMGRLARRAIRKDNRDARAYRLAGLSECMRGRHKLGRELLEQALRLNPGMAAAYANIGSTYLYQGQPERALEHLETALRLSPNDAYIFHTLGEKAVARYMQGDYREALALAKESLSHRPGYPLAHVIEIGCLARMERMGEAREALAVLLERRPNFSAREVKWLPFTDRRWINDLLEGVRLAGYDADRKPRV